MKKERCEMKETKTGRKLYKTNLSNIKPKKTSKTRDIIKPPKNSTFNIDYKQFN